MRFISIIFSIIKASWKSCTWKGFLVQRFFFFFVYTAVNQIHRWNANWRKLLVGQQSLSCTRFPIRSSSHDVSQQPPIKPRLSWKSLAVAGVCPWMAVWWNSGSCWRFRTSVNLELISHCWHGGIVPVRDNRVTRFLIFWYWYKCFKSWHFYLNSTILQETVHSD